MSRISRKQQHGTADRSERTYIQLYAIAPAPSRDYHGLKVTEQQVILNTWNVTHGRYVFPKVRKIDLTDFVDDKAWQQDVTVIFGEHMCAFIADIAARSPALHCVPNRAMLKIMSFLSCNDILRLSQTSKTFWQLCNSNSVWRIMFMKRARRRPAATADLGEGSTFGWKQALRKSLDTRSILHRVGARHGLKPSTSLHEKRALEPGPDARPKSKSLTDLKRDRDADAARQSRTSRFSKLINPNYCQLETDE